MKHPGELFLQISYRHVTVSIFICWMSITYVIYIYIYINYIHYINQDTIWQKRNSLHSLKVERESGVLVARYEGLYICCGKCRPSENIIYIMRRNKEKWEKWENERMKWKNALLCNWLMTWKRRRFTLVQSQENIGRGERKYGGEITFC